jgi:cell wall-associated NlpC family hydrolase
MDSSESVFGESCVGVRHFDCIGFVNYIMGQVQQRQWNIASWIKHTQEVQLKDAMAGDILTKSGHIGLAVSPSHVVHASDTQYGVIETSIGKGSWTRCGRMSVSFWLCYELTPGTIDFTFEQVENYA